MPAHSGVWAFLYLKGVLTMSNTKRFLEHIEDQARHMSKAELMAEYPYTGVAALWDEVNGPQQAELPNSHAPFDDANHPES